MQIILQRYPDLPHATLGVLYLPNKQFIYTLEEPWRQNKPQVSRVPAGKYRCVPHGWEANATTKYKQVWRLESVPNRKAILFHGGNSVDDTLGCILVGFEVTARKDGSAVVTGGQSGPALSLMRKVIGNKAFDLQIFNAANSLEGVV